MKQSTLFDPKMPVFNGADGSLASEEKRPGGDHRAGTLKTERHFLPQGFVLSDTDRGILSRALPDMDAELFKGPVSLLSLDEWDGLLSVLPPGELSWRAKAVIAEVISRQLSAPSPADACEVLQEKKKSGYYPRLIVFGVFSVVGIVMDGVFGVSGIKELLLFLPWISPPVALILTVFFMLINAAIFYGYDIGTLRKALDIDAHNEGDPQLAAETRFLNATALLNKKLMARETHQAFKDEPAAFAHLAKMTARFNRDVSAAKRGPYKEDAKKRGARLFVTVCGLPMAIGTGYSAAITLLGLCGVAATATLGIATIAFFIAAVAGIYLVYRSKSMIFSLDPYVAQHKELEKAGEDFQAGHFREERHFKEAYSTEKYKEVSYAVKAKATAHKIYGDCPGMLFSRPKSSENAGEAEQINQVSPNPGFSGY